MPDRTPLDAERLMRMAEEEDAPPSTEEELKAALLRQQHREHFEVPDPSDDTDDEIWDALPESFRRQS